MKEGVIVIEMQKSCCYLFKFNEHEKLTFNWSTHKAHRDHLLTYTASKTPTFSFLKQKNDFGKPNKCIQINRQQDAEMLFLKLFWIKDKVKEQIFKLYIKVYNWKKPQLTVLAHAFRTKKTKPFKEISIPKWETLSVCENQKFDMVFQRMDEETPNINNNKLYCLKS